jgi:hypothetical protein
MGDFCSYLYFTYMNNVALTVGMSAAEPPT